MRRFLAGFLAAGICVASLAGCELEENIDSVSATVCGQIEKIEGRNITIQLGSWEEDHFTASGGQTVLALPEEKAMEKARENGAGPSASASPIVVFGEGCTPVYADELEVGDIIKVVLHSRLEEDKMEIRVEQLE